MRSRLEMSEGRASNRAVPVRTTVDAQDAYRFLGLEPPA